MSDQATPHYQTASRARPVSGWAVGVTLFAAIMMLMTGMFQALAGLVAIFENEFSQLDAGLGGEWCGNTAPASAGASCVPAVPSGLLSSSCLGE